MIRYLIVGMIGIGALNSASAGILYVDGSAGGANNGTSWANAFTNLQAAIDAAEPDTDIWMAEGIYCPPNTGLGRDAGFRLKDGIRIYGGYPSGGGQFEQRNPTLHRSVLTGDLQDNDSESPESLSDNCYHVVIANDACCVRLDGLEVTGGNADGPDFLQQIGGGIYANGNLTIVGCRIVKNRAVTGAGLYCCPRMNIVTKITLRDCRIETNTTAGDGGGVYLGDSDLQFENCMINHNQAGQRGGGIMFGNDNVSSLKGCRILDNSAGADGGGMYLMFSFQLSVVDCEISNNQSGECGGGIYHGYDTDMDCKQSIFRDNFSMDDGGAIYHQQGQPVYEGCRFEGNRALTNGGGICNEQSESRFADCLFQGNHAMACKPGSPCDDASGGGIFSYAGKTTVEGCRLIDNKAWLGGGLCQMEGVAIVRNSYIQRNRATECGGGVYLSNVDSQVDQCVFVRNTVSESGGQGGGVWNGGGVLRIRQCSMQSNWADDAGSGIFNANEGFLLLVNSIVRDSVWNSSGTTWLFTYSNIIEFADNDTNIDQDPLFREMPWGEMEEEGGLGNLRLRPESPCINAGSSSVIEPGATDLDGQPRIRGRVVDMGAYEFPSPCVIYVDDSAVGANNGTSWTDAYLYLQDALAYALAGDEIRVAQGIYRPDQSAYLDGLIPGDRKASFKMRGGVAILGGYAGFGAANPDERHLRRFETILSGDLKGDDTGGWYDPSRSDNSYNVVRAAGQLTGAVLDGVTITGGYSNDSGGGIYCHTGVSVMIRNCVIRGNFAMWGGGLYDSWSTTSQVSQCVFTDNYSSQGGGIYLNGELCMALDHCLIYGNEAEWGGGIYLDEAYTSIVNCTVANNHARDQWGGVIDRPGTSHFWSCIFWGNTSSDGSVEWAQIGRNDGWTAFDYCCVQGWTGQFAGVGTIDADPLFANTSNGDYHLKSRAGRWDPFDKTWVKDDVSSPCIDGGDPFGPIGLEPFPNGGVVNIGAYGGTIEASKSWFGRECQAIYPGDINGDCRVDLTDFAILARFWLQE